MNVLIVDDHEVIWNGMRTMLERLCRQSGLSSIEHFHGCRSVEAAGAFAGGAFDLILLDYHLPGLSGLEALRHMREAFESSPVVVVSADADPRRVREAIAAGASGYVPKTMSEKEMQAAFALVLVQGVYLPPMALLEVDPPAISASEGVLAESSIESFVRQELSPRQREVFSRALRGKPNKVIARELGIAEGTVKVHLAMVFRALGVRNRTEAMYRVLSAGAADAMERL